MGAFGGSKVREEKTLSEIKQKGKTNVIHKNSFVTLSSADEKATSLGNHMNSVWKAIHYQFLETLTLSYIPVLFLTFLSNL